MIFPMAKKKIAKLKIASSGSTKFYDGNFNLLGHKNLFHVLCRHFVCSCLLSSGSALMLCTSKSNSSENLLNVNPVDLV